MISDIVTQERNNALKGAELQLLPANTMECQSWPCMVCMTDIPRDSNTGLMKRAEEGATGLVSRSPRTPQPKSLCYAA